MRMDAILQVNDITLRYKNGRGVRDVNLEVRRGDIFGLFGPNGSGKTTLLKIMTGLIRPERGRVRLFGCDISDQFEDAIRPVGCVIESADVYEELSAYDNLKLAGRFYRGLTRTRIEQVLEQVGLVPFSREKAGGFSLGMRMRLALAAALLPGPQLVILDEPTNGLDIEGMADIRRTIRQLACEQGVAFLISSHMIADMEKLVNRIAILQHGVIMRQGVIGELVPEGTTLEQFYLSQVRHTKEDGDHEQPDGQLAE